MSTQPRKPRIALMGEFSAGKSTLSNLLLGARPLPEKVTATRLSPVWMSHGTSAPYRVDVDGSEEEIVLDNLESISVDETRVIRLFFDADVLQLCDLIDFPGISDPNMSSEIWQRMLNEVDAILWCTHATQAWRQSESAVWDTIPDAAKAHSALLITRFDKLTSERDEQRVLARLAQETAGQFAGTFPISLTDALAAGDDFDAFEASGGIDFLEYFLAMVEKLAAQIGTDGAPLCADRMIEGTQQPVARSAVEPRPVAASVAAPAVDMQTPAAPEDDEPLSLASLAPAMAAPADVTAQASAFEETVPEMAAHIPAPQPEARPEPVPAAETDSVLPRRVRPNARGSRRPRPAGATKNFDLAGALGDEPASPSQHSAAQLRAVFQEAPDVTER